MSKIILHLKPSDVSSELKGWHLRLYRSIGELCESEGIDFQIRQRDPEIRVGTRALDDERFDDGDLHIIDDRSLQAKGVLNAGVAYLWEFWHLDPVGTKAFSSIGRAAYDPEAVSAQRSQTFVSNLKRRYLEKRKSKYNQPEERRTLPSNAISVFFQGIYPINSGATRYSDIDVLLATQAAVGDQPIIVKPHPLSSNAADKSMVEELARQDDRIVITDANVHDILDNSACTISINSTVALEGYMHGVPAVLFGTSDFHHVSTTITDLKLVSSALETALLSDTDFERYLSWYFLKHCIHLNSGKLHEKLWEQFSEVGFPRERFN